MCYEKFLVLREAILDSMDIRGPIEAPAGIETLDMLEISIEAGPPLTP